MSLLLLKLEAVAVRVVVVVVPAPTRGRGWGAISLITSPLMSKNESSPESPVKEREIHVTIV